MSEQYSDLASSNLTANYSAGSGVLTVNNTAGDNANYPFPVSTPFSLSVWDTTTTPPTQKVILKVNTITDGHNFAVAAEGHDANAAAGNTAFGALTKRAITAIKFDAFTQAINTVAFSATPNFDLSLGDQQIVLTGNVSSSTFSNLTQGRRYTFFIKQDGVGSRTFVWPTAMHGTMTIGSTLSTVSVQEFESPDGVTLYALSTGVQNVTI